MTYKPFENSESSKWSKKIHGRTDTTEEVSYDVTVTRDTVASKNYLEVSIQKMRHFAHLILPPIIEDLLGATTYDEVDSSLSGNVETLDFLLSSVSQKTITITYTASGFTIA